MDRISLFGSIDITWDRQELAYAEVLKSLLVDIIAPKADTLLEDKISIKPVVEVPNPFVDKKNKF